MGNLATAPLSTRFEHLFQVLSSKKFLQMEGLGNEIPFFICPFPPRESNEMAEAVEGLKHRLEIKGIRVLLINLYDLSIEILKEQGVWDALLEQEAQLGRDEVLDLLQNVLDPESRLVPAIESIVENGIYDMLLLTGIGEVYPYLRAHTILNNLQSKIKEFPTVLFYPGEYTFTPERGSTLKLFGRLHDANYYRAFNLFDIQP